MRLVAGLVAAVLVLAWPAVAAAHPLGNFTINQYSRVVVSVDGIAIRYVLDMAEIPAFQEQSRIDSDGNDQVSDTETAAYLDAIVGKLLDEIDLHIDGAPTELRLLSRELSFPDGQGGLRTLRLVLDLEADLPSRAGNGTYTADAYPERLGWREVVVQPGNGISLAESNVPVVDVSDELRSYPAESVEQPLNVGEATFAYRPGAGGSVAPGAGAPGTAASDDLLTTLLRGELSLLPALLAVGVSMMLGAVHAVSPGHGKTLVAAYLIGSGGTLREAIWLGITVAITHTIGIFILGGATLIAGELFVPERVIGWLAVVAGVTVVMLGIGLVVQQVMRRGSRQNAQHGHGHDHGGHDLGHDHGGHDHGYGSPPPTLTSRRLLGLGLAGGLVPSASALLVLLLAITLDRLAFGLLLIVAFGVGMAVVLGAVSASVLLVRERVRQSRESRWRKPWISRIGRRLPLVSAFVVVVIGIIVTVRAVAALG